MNVVTHRHSESKPWTYEDLNALQHDVKKEVRSGQPGKIIFSEVAPVITLGKRNTSEDLLLTPDEYKRRGISILEVSRGGRATYHGPGQWVVFIVEKLEKLTGDSRGVRKLVDGLFSAMLEVVREEFPGAEIREGKEAGIWSDAGEAGAKIAALGVQIEEGVVLHGFSVNVFRTSTSFQGLNPCGLTAPVGYLEDASERSPEVRSMVFLAWRDKLGAALKRSFPAL